MAGSLVNDLAVDAASIEINLFLRPLAAKLQEADPLPLPTATTPGVIWVEDERIEYFGYSRTADVVTVSALRRATRGTSTGAKRLVQTGVGTGSPQTFYFSSLGSLDVTFDGVIQPPSVYSGTEIYSGTHVNFTAPAGAYVVLGLSISASHLAGAAVWNGQQVLAADPSLPVNLMPVSDFGISAANSGNIVTSDGIGIGHANGSSTIYAVSGSTSVSGDTVATASGDAISYAVGVIGIRSLLSGGGHSSAYANSGALGMALGGGMVAAIGDTVAAWSALNLGGSTALGCSDDGSIVVGTSAAFAVQFSGGTITTLPYLSGVSGGAFFVARGCSADGSIIVGSCPDADDYTRAVKWSGGTITDLGMLPGATSVYACAYGCSSDGSIIVGTANNAINQQQAVYWESGTITALSNGSYTGITVALDCSDDGSIITGYASDGTNNYAVYWTKSTGALTTLGMLAPGYIPGGCSGDGTIMAATTGSGAIYYTIATGTPTTLSLLPGGTYAYAYACSENGHYIVGAGDAGIDGNNHPILWTADGTATMLPALTGMTGGYPGEANWISRDGSIIVGDGNDTSGAQVAIKWTA
jgi:probable HAF family extracellular repeat protein